MTNLVETLYSWLSFVRHISLRNLLEIVIIAFLVYEILLWIKNTRAWTLLKGIAVILGFTVFVYVLRLDTIFWIMTRLAFVATTALVIIFQPEAAQGPGGAGKPESDLRDLLLRRRQGEPGLHGALRQRGGEGHL